MRQNVYQDPARKKPKTKKKATPNVDIKMDKLKVIIKRASLSPPKVDNGDTRHTLRNSTVKNTEAVNKRLELEELEQHKRKVLLFGTHVH